MAAEPGGEDAYFRRSLHARTQARIANAIKRKFRKHRAAAQPTAMFARVERDDDLDQWQVRRQNLVFHWRMRMQNHSRCAFRSIRKRSNTASNRFRSPGFTTSDSLRSSIISSGSSAEARPFVFIAHGGGQFSLSAKTFLTGSLLADDIAYKASHPELATWIMDWPNPDDRAFRRDAAPARCIRRRHRGLTGKVGFIRD
jgi:hypothetical protein